jgi:hypothetical protein
VEVAVEDGTVVVAQAAVVDVEKVVLTKAAAPPQTLAEEEVAALSMEWVKVNITQCPTTFQLMASTSQA